MSITPVLSLSLFLLTASFHPLHVSVTEIEYDEKEKELEIMVRVFLEDLEKGIQNQQEQPELNLLKPIAGHTTDALVGEYLKSHLTLSVDGNALPLHYLGFEEEGEALIGYIQVTEVGAWKAIEVTNNLLMEVFEDQSNIVHVIQQKKIKSMRLSHNNPTGKLSFTL